ncbi:MAG TPA: hypothetical protein GX723_03360 [Thermoanaerobacterales bacterium]|nr:hypothetical protein [Thermoanaerobacterales bacterium]
MENSKPSLLAKIIMAAMAIVSFSNLFGLNLSSAAIIIGVLFFFVDNMIQRQPMRGSGLDLRAISTNLKDKKCGSGWCCRSLWMQSV